MNLCDLLRRGTKILVCVKMFDKRQMENEMIKYSQNNNMRMFIFQFKSWIDPLMIARFKIQIWYILCILFKTRYHH